MKSLLGFIIKISIVAVAYFIGGRLGLFLAIPPGFATAIWPASGVALAAILLWGKRYWPGIFLGSFAINLFISYQDQGLKYLFSSMVLASIIAMAAVLQAIISNALIKRFVRFPTALEDTKDIGILLFLGGAIGCLINSTISVSALWLFDIISIDLFLVNWMTWWIGDAIGVFVFTPILLLIWTPVGFVSKLRKVTVSLLLLFAFGISIIIFYIAKGDHHEQRNYVFQENALKVSLELEKDIRSYLDILAAVESFINSSEYVTYNEFNEFTKRFFTRYLGIQAISWNPKVLDKERKVFQKSVQLQGYPNFIIKDRISLGALDASPHRSTYFPVTYVMPYDANQKAHGFDTYAPDDVTDNIRIKVLETARNRGVPIITSRISLVQAEDKYGAIIYHPVYKKGFDQQKGRNFDYRSDALLGYVAGAFIIPEMIEAIYGMPKIRESLSVILEDVTLPDNVTLLYDSRTVDFKAPKTPIKINDYALSRSTTFEMAGRQWKLTLVEDTKGLKNYTNWQLWFILIGGLLFVGLLGVLLLFVTARTDIVQRMVKQKTDQLNNVQRRMALILDNMGEGIYGVGVDGKIIFANKASSEMLGYDISEMMLQDQHQLIHHSYADGSAYPFSECNIRKVLENGKACTIDTDVFWKKDGEYFSAEYGATPIVDSAEEITGVVVVFRDITERKKIHDTLLESERFFRSAIEHSAVGMALVSPDGAWLKVNKTLCHIVGYDEDELLKTNFQAITYPDDLETDLTLIEEVLSGKIETYQIEKRYIHKKEHTVWVLLSISLVRDTNDQPLYFVSQIQDISKRKIIEVRLEEAKLAADAANKAKSEFLATMSHEIRTPLNGVIGMAELLEMTELTERQSSYVKNICMSGDLLLALINDILDFSRIEAGELTLEEISVDLIELVNEVHELFKLQAEEKGLSLVLELDESTPRYVMGDPLRLKQVFINFVGNAVKFTEKGSITIKSKLLPYEDANKARIRFQIIDTGIGIEKSKLASIFNQFSQGDSSTTRKYGGTGLGLAICVRLVTLMEGGEVGVKNNIGEGANFRFNALYKIDKNRKDVKNHQKPKVIEKAKESTSNKKEARTSKKLKQYTSSVLVVEDFVPNQEVAVEVLKQFGCKVSVAEDGEEALDMLKENPRKYRLVFMDCQMPIMDGYEATKAIRKEKWGQKLAIVAMTANCEATEEKHCLEVGMNDYISKPIRLLEIERVLEKYLGRKKPSTE